MTVSQGRGINYQHSGKQRTRATCCIRATIIGDVAKSPQYPRTVISPEESECVDCPISDDTTAVEPGVFPMRGYPGSQQWIREPFPVSEASSPYFNSPGPWVLSDFVLARFQVYTYRSRLSPSFLADWIRLESDA